MIVKGVTVEDFINYKVPSMFIAMPRCTFKCEKECGLRCCQNSELVQAPDIDVDDDTLARTYLNNSITRAICFGGLEPMDSFEEVFNFIKLLRTKYHCSDTCVIYTGYNKIEVLSQLAQLAPLGNIIVKTGRFVPNQKPHYDQLLGVYLASDNQMAELVL